MPSKRQTPAPKTSGIPSHLLQSPPVILFPPTSTGASNAPPAPSTHTSVTQHSPGFWPRGHFHEAGTIFGDLTRALARLLIWLVAAFGRLLLGFFRLLALGLGWIATLVSRGRLHDRSAEIAGWVCLAVILGGTLGGLVYTQRWYAFLSHTGIVHRTVIVPSGPTPTFTRAPTTCAQPRLSCSPPTRSVDGFPSVSASQLLSILQSYNSPAATPDFANALYDLGVQYGVNPAYALAFFVEESTCGTRGVAAMTHSLGNIRFDASDSPVNYRNYEGYRSYSSWKDGAEDWYWVIRNFYINRNTRDIFAITPIYAPSNDNNDPLQYARTVYDLVLQWGHA